MSKDVVDPLRADEKFVIPNLSLSCRPFVQRTKAIPDLIEVW